MSRERAATLHRRARVALPAVLLVGIAMTNRVVVAQTNLSPWDLGGFGMFSTIDAPANRVVRLTAETEQGPTVELIPGVEFAEAIDALQVFPTDGRATSLADDLRGERWEVDGDDEAEPAGDGVALGNVQVVIGRVTFDELAGELVFVELARGNAP